MRRSAMKTSLLITTVCAAFFAALALPSASRTGSVPSSPTRCCFEVSVYAGTTLQAFYPTCNHEEPCSDDEREFWVGGYHTILASWQGSWLARYTEVNRAPYLASAALSASSSARIEAGLEDKVDWSFPSRAEHIAVTGGMERGTNGWMPAKRMLSFIGPGSYLHVAPGPAIWNTVAKCGSKLGGPSYHGRSLARADWDGLDGPWQWVVKSPPRVRFRYATKPFSISSSQSFKRQETRGGRFHLISGTDSLTVFFVYFPEKDLQKRLKQFAGKHPITSRGLKTLSDVLLDNTRTPIGRCDEGQSGP
jgi:hypothetical protein